MILFDRNGKSADIPEDEVAEAIESGKYAESPSFWGIETCPGVEPCPMLAARRAELEAAIQKSEPYLSDNLDMPGDWTDMDSMSIDQLYEVARNRSIQIDRRWGKTRVIEALSDNRA